MSWYSLETLKKDIYDWQVKIDAIMNRSEIPSQGRTEADMLDSYKHLKLSAKSGYKTAKILLNMINKEGYTFDFKGHTFIDNKPETALCHFCQDVMGESAYKLLKNKEPVVVFPKTSDHNCHKCGKGHLKLMVDKKAKVFSLIRSEYVRDPNFREVLITEPCMYADGFKPYSVELDVKSGTMLLANHFRRLYDLEKVIGNEYYGNEFSINQLHGRKRTSEELAKLGCIDLNVGNCHCAMYKTPRRARVPSSFVVGGYLEYDNEALVKYKEYKEVGDVCTDYWGYCVVDKDAFLALVGSDDLEPNQYEGKKLHSKSQDVDITPVVCKPGRYRFTHRYHECDEGSSEIYTRIEWIGPCS